ncbi:glycosyltransferase family 4 protein [Uliginosibacterium sp. TH139]|uniref:glycosyltransferase family 4 protein n=1 Tax=Uliginosibacterium sp. TH139 TaxID=2067453 RepID=UPI000C7E0C15|nr:glycosyltransferase family 4 protein [Uliginosibacterium sp. TH139]PLK48675.1 glycosyltransferase family 1 protein [Uliginosibacterium sp. TH139]
MKIVLFANTDWFLYNFKLSLAKALRARGDEVLLLSPPGDYGPRLRDLGFRWEPLPVSRSGVNPLAELAVIRRIARLYREEKPDLVHHFTIKCVIYGSFAARQAGIAGIVNSVTGLGFALLADALKARLIRPVVLGLYRLALRGTQVVFQNRDNRDTLASYGVLANSGVQVIAGDGIDTAHFAPAPRVPQQATVLMMARLLHSKGIADFVAAAQRVRQVRPDVRFLLAGAPDPGNPESVTEAELTSWRASAAVEFLGQRSDVLALNQSASIVVLASTQGEGIPRALLEGAACGVPMVATDVPGCRDVVVDDETGYLVPPSEGERLAEALLDLLQDEAKRRRMGEAARRHVEANFSDQVVIAQTLAVYARAGGRASA